MYMEVCRPRAGYDRHVPVPDSSGSRRFGDHDNLDVSLQKLVVRSFILLAIAKGRDLLSCMYGAPGRTGQ